MNGGPLRKSDKRRRKISKKPRGLCTRSCSAARAPKQDALHASHREVDAPSIADSDLCAWTTTIMQHISASRMASDLVRLKQDRLVGANIGSGSVQLRIQPVPESQLQSEIGCDCRHDKGQATGRLPTPGSGVTPAQPPLLHFLPRSVDSRVRLALHTARSIREALSTLFGSIVPDTLLSLQPFPSTAIVDICSICPLG